VFQFDTADHAASAVEPIHAELLASFDDDTVTLEPTNPGDSGDQVLAAAGVGTDAGT
jgi:hypothetical protein